mgnify:CR=1 FL=1
MIINNMPLYIPRINFDDMDEGLVTQALSKQSFKLRRYRNWLAHRNIMFI